MNQQALENLHLGFWHASFFTIEVPNVSPFGAPSFITKNFQVHFVVGIFEVLLCIC
jgi:hypothetical protein